MSEVPPEVKQRAEALKISLKEALKGEDRELLGVAIDGYRSWYVEFVAPTTDLAQSVTRLYLQALERLSELTESPIDPSTYPRPSALGEAQSKAVRCPRCGTRYREKHDLPEVSEAA